MSFDRHALQLAAACSILLPTHLNAQPASRAKLVASVDSIIETARKADRTPGITVAVVRGNDTLVMKGYGIGDVEHQIRVTPRSVFHIASITKQFTAAAVMRLVEQGKLRLDGTVGDYLTDYDGPARRATLHQLLTHTAGVPNFTDMRARMAEISRIDLTHQQMLAVWSRGSLAFEPGSRWAYSNSGYYLLGMIIEKAAGESYAQHLRKTQWEPLGLSETYYCAQREIIPHRVRSYGVQNGTLFNAPPASVNVPFASGALCSTPRDLVRWTRALHGGRVVSPRSFAQMIAPVRLTDGSTNPYAYGLTNARIADVPAVQHGGGFNGFSANLAHYPAQNLTIAVIVNGPSSSSTLSQRIAYLALGIPDPAAVDLPTTPVQRARYLGGYEIGQDRMQVLERDGRLVAQLGSSSPIPLRRVGEHTFAGPPEAGITLVFTLAGDEVTGFTIPASGGMRGTRVK